MIGKEELTNEEDSDLKVTDKRKFNVDGSLREGVILKKEPSKKEEPVASPDSPIVTAAENTTPLSELAESQTQKAAENVPDVGGDSEEELLDTENPASFVNFLSTLVTNAAISLGAMPHPVSGQKGVDLETARHWIDVLLMLRKKTEGNLLSQERTLLDSILSDLQLQYVSLTKATEEKLKARAAQKFSSKDILGG